jgi:D-amino peptidase
MDAKESVFISCDMEGLVGIVSNRQRNLDGSDYSKACLWMTEEVNAVIKGLVRCDAEEFIINDSHDSMQNLLLEKLHPEGKLLIGQSKPLSMMEGIDESFGGVMFLGYHARWGIAEGLLAHTYSEMCIDTVHLNGQAVGETTLNAALAGYFGVPVLLVSGDQKVAEEVQEMGTGTTSVIVKESRGRTCGIMLPLEKIRAMLENAAIDAWEKRKDIEPFVLDTPIEITIKLQETQMADIAERIPDVIRVDDLTVQYTHDDYLTVYKAFLAVLCLAASTRPRS